VGAYLILTFPASGREAAHRSPARKKRGWEKQVQVKKVRRDRIDRRIRPHFEEMRGTCTFKD